MLLRTALLALLLAFGVLSAAQAQSALTPREDERARLFAALKAAQEPRIARHIENLIWEFWVQGPDKASTSLLREAMRARNVRNFDRSLEILNRLVSDYPRFPEAWNQRAIIHYEKGKYDESLDDIIKVLELEPKHFGALSGRAFILMRQGRMKTGQAALRAAVDIHPWLRERSMLRPKPKELDL